MCKKLNKIGLFSIILIFMFIKVVYGATIEKKTVSSWHALKDAIENSTASELEIQLSGSSWTADSTITIPKSKKVTLNTTSSISIKRSNTYKNSLITNNGTLNIKTSSSSVKITLDGNKANVQATRSLIRVENGNLSIKNIVLQNNKNQNAGGGLTVIAQANNSTIKIDTVTFKNNEASAGGGIYVGSDTCKTELNNVKIESNKAVSASGGGIYAYGNLTISGENTLISKNTAKTFGGGIMIKNKCTINNGVISDNKVIDSSGGGIRVDGNLILNKATIKNNSAKGNGGGIDFNLGWFNPNKALQDKTLIVENNTAGGVGPNTYPDISLYKDWTTDKSLNLKNVNIKLMKSYIKGKEVENCPTQGMAIGKKYIICAQSKSENENTYINIIDKSSYKLLNVDNSHCFYHANGITYNKTEDRYYVSYNRKVDSTTESCISSFKINSSYKITDIQTKKVTRYYCGIAYDEDDNCFIGVYGQKMYIMDKDFKELRSFDAKTYLTKQDVTYFGGHIYYGCYESGHVTSYQNKQYNSKEKHSNLIYVYDLNGVLEKTIFIPYTKVNGELEGLYVQEDGSIIISYNFLDNEAVVFYKITDDVVGPKISIKYDINVPTRENVTATITSNEKMQAVSGWSLSTDKKILTKKFATNTTVDVTFKDLAGNTSIAKVNIANIFMPNGDTNGNKKIDVGDVLIICRHLATKNNTKVAQEHPTWQLDSAKEIIADVSKNGTVDIGDILKLNRYMAAKNSTEVSTKHPDWLNL